MTIHNHLLIGLEDIHSIHFECKKCGATISIPPAKWERSIPFQCNNCKETWMQVTGASEGAIRDISNALAQLLKDAKGMQCILSFEISNSGEAQPTHLAFAKQDG